MKMIPLHPPTSEYFTQILTAKCQQYEQQISANHVDDLDESKLYFDLDFGGEVLNWTY